MEKYLRSNIFNISLFSIDTLIYDFNENICKVTFKNNDSFCVKFSIQDINGVFKLKSNFIPEYTSITDMSILGEINDKIKQNESDIIIRIKP